MRVQFWFVNTPSETEYKIIEFAGASLEPEHLKLGHVMYSNKIHRLSN